MPLRQIFQETVLLNVMHQRRAWMDAFKALTVASKSPPRDAGHTLQSPSKWGHPQRPWKASELSGATSQRAGSAIPRAQGTRPSLGGETGQISNRLMDLTASYELAFKAKEAERSIQLSIEPIRYRFTIKEQYPRTKLLWESVLLAGFWQ